MTLVRFAPLQSMARAETHFNSVLDSLLGDAGSDCDTQCNSWSPNVDVEETDEAIILRADLPGLNKDDVSISTKDDELTIRGERKTESESKDRSFYRAERGYGSFSRTFKMPATIQPKHVEATYTDGVLKVAVAKSETAKPFNIEIKR